MNEVTQTIENSNVVEYYDYEKEQLELEKQQQELITKRNTIIDKRLKDHDRRIKELNDNGIKVDTAIKMLKETNKELKSELCILANRKFSKEWRIWKDCASKELRNRIFNRNLSSPYAILFYDSFRSWMYSDVAKTVGADCASRIYIEKNDMSTYNASLVCLKNWYPDKFRKSQKEKEYRRKYEQDLLTGQKLIAWEKYLEETKDFSKIDGSVDI